MGLRTVKGCVRVGDWTDDERRLAKSIVVAVVVHFQVTLSVTNFRVLSPPKVVPFRPESALPFGFLDFRWLITDCP